MIKATTWPQQWWQQRQFFLLSSYLVKNIDFFVVKTCWLVKYQIAGMVGSISGQEHMELCWNITCLDGPEVQYDVSFKAEDVDECQNICQNLYDCKSFKFTFKDNLCEVGIGELLATPHCSVVGGIGTVVDENDFITGPNLQECLYSDSGCMVRNALSFDNSKNSFFKFLFLGLSLPRVSNLWLCK